MQATTQFTQRFEKYNRVGFYTLGFFLLLILLSATLLKISGAVIAPGKVVQTGENKSVQHPAGGAILELLVENGEHVSQGQPLVVLAGSRVQSQFALFSQREFEYRLKLDRLKAQASDAETFTPDPSVYGENLVRHAEVVQTQVDLFTAQRAYLEATQAQVSDRLRGLDVEHGALDTQKQTNQQQLQFINESIEEIQDLFDRQLVSKARLTGLKRERVTVNTQLSALDVQMQQNRNLATAATQQLNTTIRQMKESLWKEIEATEARLAESRSQLVALTDEQERLVITAPATGVVHDLAVRNVNAVVGPRDVIMQIVPATVSPMITAKVRAEDVEQIELGQEVRVRLDSISSQSVPELVGAVAKISADSKADEKTGKSFFEVSVELPESDGSAEIFTGLPVSTMFTTNERTLLSYLVRPLSKQMFRAFRED